MDAVKLFCCKCLQLLSPPIKQCNNKHSVCGKCQAETKDDCPKCAGTLNAITYDELERVITQLNKEKVTFPCVYECKGCTYKVEQAEKLVHQSECKFRTFECEGKKYCGWKCDWSGNYDQILSHFKHFHDCSMSFKIERATKMNLDDDSLSLEPIDYYDGCALFWYKHKVDTSAQMVYWVIQYVGLQKDAAQYFYEFEIHDGPIRKIKVTEFCEGDSMDANSIFKSGQCVALSIPAVRSFLNMEDYLNFRFRVMKVKKPSTPKVEEHPSPSANIPSLLMHMHQAHINARSSPRNQNHFQKNKSEKKRPYFK
ncbi:hypothetical protein RI129_009434 [Pyrocoelia pectoralis]|uniref:E3 ubiquitin-protein ligase n=1 Tax=Pyrocoelia pectoralis TaxID=417401 RepID=A0AAN7V4M3_9COLE